MVLGYLFLNLSLVLGYCQFQIALNTLPSPKVPLEASGGVATSVNYKEVQLIKNSIEFCLEPAVSVYTCKVFFNLSADTT